MSIVHPREQANPVSSSSRIQVAIIIHLGERARKEAKAMGKMAMQQRVLGITPGTISAALKDQGLRLVGHIWQMDLTVVCHGLLDFLPHSLCLVLLPLSRFGAHNHKVER